MSVTHHFFTTRMLKATNLSKKYGETQAVQSADFSVGDGEFVTIVGPSGCGKSTTLRMLAGHLEPTTGSISLDGTDITHIPPNERSTCLVFQTWALFPHMSVKENISFPITVRGESPNGRPEELLELVQLDPEEHGYKKPGELSQGQQQRVALARSLAYDPEILLLDEPLANLDYLLQKELQRDLADLNDKLGTTFIYVTHSLESALLMSDRVFVMDVGEFVQTGPPEEIYLEPANSFIAEFMGDANLIDISVEARENGSVKITGREFQEPRWVSEYSNSNQSPTEIVVRYDDAYVDTDLTADIGFPTKIKNILIHGNRGLVETESIATGDEYIADMTIQRLNKKSFEKGDKVYFQWDEEKSILVSED